MQQNEVDIAGIVQFAGTQLAHAEHGEAAGTARLGGMRQAQIALRMAVAQQVRHAQPQRGLRQFGQRRRDLLQAPQPADIGDRDRQGHRTFGRAHAGGYARTHGARLEFTERGHRGIHHRIRAGLGQRAQHPRLADCQIGEVGRIAAEAAQHGGEGRLAGQPRLRTAEFRITLHQPFPGSGIGRCGPVGRQTGGQNLLGAHHRVGWA